MDSITQRIPPSYIKEYKKYKPSGTYFSYNLWSESLFAACPLKKLYIGRDCNYRTGDYGVYYEDQLGDVYSCPKISPFCHQNYDEITIGGSVSMLYGITFKASNCNVMVLKHGTEPLNIIEDRRPDYDPFYETWDIFNTFLNNLKSATVDRNTVTDIGLFSKKEELHEVFIGDNLKHPNTRFNNCPNLIDVKFGSLVESITDGMFAGCNNLRSIDLPHSLVSIGENAFANTPLESIEFHNQLKSIGYGAFRNTLISDLTFPSSIQDLGNYCFGDCSNLKRVVLPENINIVPSDFFRNCHSLKEVHFQPGLKELSDQAFYGCHALSRLEMPSSLEIIGEDAFGNCVNLKSILLGPALHNIGNRAFADSDLDSIISLSANPPIIEDQDCFNHFTYLNCKVEIPRGCYNSYSSSEVWKCFWEIKENDELNSGIADICNPVLPEGIDYNSPYEVFSLNGIYVNNSYNNLPSGLYIVRQGVHRAKIIIHN